MISKEVRLMSRFPAQTDSLYNQPYPLKFSYNSVIPLNIFQTWGTKDLPPKMKANIDDLKKKNPEFTYYLFDDDDCREFIKKHFETDVLVAYDTLIPGAFKADLWRLCVLYIHGGIYMDIKLRCINNFKLMELTESEHYVRDRLGMLSIYNALMVCKSKNPFLIEAIKRIVQNVKTKSYSNSALHITGPAMLGGLILEKSFDLNVDMFFKMAGLHLVYKHRFVIETIYPGYHQEQADFYKSKNTTSYGELWNKKQVYNDDKFTNFH
jgi:mannosyltransferase OCH1-like enzyme